MPPFRYQTATILNLNCGNYDHAHSLAQAGPRLLSDQLGRPPIPLRRVSNNRMGVILGEWVVLREKVELDSRAAQNPLRYGSKEGKQFPELGRRQGIQRTDELCFSRC